MSFKYYTLKYVDKMKEGFGGEARAFRIEILEKYRNDKGLLEHEKCHVREWWFWLFAGLLITGAVWYFVDGHWWVLGLLVSPWLQGILYRNKYYRMWSEATAYKIQIKVGNYSSTKFAVNAMMNKYGLGLSEKEAKKKLGLD
ncbi:MAG: hypothetical protein CL678_14595 [Bdellovibrionaceae bacterium]|nr:hypothetical protein [Pseudobdellovibrionaceae bacterium]|tara:strand:- start:2283 stop:2708 length:426 start_codon:yes stop_codon:yes gene_type:complete